MKKTRIAQIIALTVLTALFAALCLLKGNTAFSVWVAGHLSRGLVESMGKLTALLPFSLYEATLYLLALTVIYFIVALAVRLKKKRGGRALSLTLSLLISAAVFLNVYTLAAGFNYNKSKVELPYYEGEIEKEEAALLAADFASEFAQLIRTVGRDADGNVINPYGTDRLSDKLSAEFDRLHIAGLSKANPKVKNIASARIMSEMHITGVFFAPYGEISINPWQASMDLPVTMAHEMAHFKGVMREDEANLVAYYVTCSSEDDYIRYCGYSAVYGRVFAAVRDDGLRNSLYSSLPAELGREIVNAAGFWNRYDALDKITDFFNDLYLKLQGVKEGTDSYIDHDHTVEVPKVDESGNETVEVVYVYSDLQKLMFNIISQRRGQTI